MERIKQKYNNKILQCKKCNYCSYLDCVRLHCDMLWMQEHTGRVFRLQFDDFQIVSSSHDDTIIIWDFLDASSPQPLQSWARRRVWLSYKCDISLTVWSVCAVCWSLFLSVRLLAILCVFSVRQQFCCWCESLANVLVDFCTSRNTAAFGVFLLLWADDRNTYSLCQSWYVCLCSGLK